MTEQSPEERYEWLAAGHALGDLSPEETAELEALESVQALDREPSPEYDDLVAALEMELSPEAEMPESLSAKLRVGTKPFVTDGARESESAEPDAGGWMKVIAHPFVGWAVAACLALAFWLSQDAGSGLVRPALAREQIQSQSDAIEWNFAGGEGFDQMTGDVVWSDLVQAGYMRLNGLPVNDATERQYQLWIVDPERDSAPVDGGVFDIDTDQGSVLIPIRATLPIDKPQAFVITVEQPGGVVVSKQEVVAAISQAP